MSDTAAADETQQARDAPAAQALSTQTTPTWEMELLLSGATIFGLLQLPDFLDRAHVRALNLSPDEYARLLMPLWVYAKVAVVTLMVTFILHLCLRGYWVALVGMDSVYRGGIRWDRIARNRPFGRAAGAAALPSMAALIESADNRATRVFGTGFGFAMVMLIPVAVVLACLAAGLLLDLLVGPGHALVAYAIVVGLLMLPFLLMRGLDRHLGTRIDPASALGRAMTRLSRLYAHIGLGEASNPLLALFVSHERWRAIRLVVLVLVPVITVIILQLSLARGALPFGFFVGLSATDPGSTRVTPSAFYGPTEDSRNAVVPLPRLPGRVVSGPYAELFVPFLPRLHGPVMEKRCPRSLALREEPAATAARLDCLARILAIQVDGRPVPVRLEATSDPASGQPGALAMLPTADLAPGRHEISLHRPSRIDGPPRRYRIAFWK